MNEETTKDINEIILKYKKDNYQENQLEEIRLGLENNINYKIYANKRYDSIQMRQIRLGLEKDIDVTKYADKGYDYLQMEEIRLGLEEKLPIDIFADKNISFAIMRQLRLGLLEGHNLKNYAALGDGILREIRYAIQDKQDIRPYILKGYESEQLEEIRYALASKCNIEKYITKQFMATAIKEIRLGLEENLDVSAYANVQYDWHQMHEIRLGLEKRLDVSKYTRVLCSWQQMIEIRLGLEDGLDVSSYCSLMYSSKDMKRRRLKLLDDRRIYEDIPATTYIYADKKYPKDEITVVLDESLMKASICVGSKVEGVTVPVLQEQLKEHNIVKGIKDNVLESIVENKLTDTLIVVAEGKYPKKGQDGYYEYFFENEENFTNISENNIQEYKFVNVNKGQKIAFYHAAESGENGYTITGKIIKAIPGKGVSIIKGIGFGLGKDNLTYVSLLDGTIAMRGNKIVITPLKIINDVEAGENEIYFNGSIYIKGNVNANMQIIASNDIIIEGYVESSFIKCGGTLCLKKGSNGNGVGKLYADEDIMGKFFENVTICSKNNIYGNTFLNCRLSAENSIRTFNEYGKIVGGNAYAGNAIIAGSIGNQVNIKTDVSVGVTDDINKSIKNTKEILSEIEHQLMLLESINEKYITSYPPEIRNTMPMYLKIEDAIYTKNIDKKEGSITNFVG